MRPPALYIIGEPGVGKSSLMARLTEGYNWLVFNYEPFAHIMYYRDLGEVERALVPTAIEFGAHHNDFPGTDRLSMAVQPKAIALASRLAESLPTTLLLGEGDRLATRSYLTALSDLYALTVVELYAEPGIARVRASARSASLQNESWAKGRRTKVARLGDWWRGEAGARGGLAFGVDTTGATGAEVARTVRAGLSLHVGEALGPA